MLMAASIIALPLLAKEGRSGRENLIATVAVFGQRLSEIEATAAEAA